MRRLALALTLPVLTAGPARAELFFEAFAGKLFNEPATLGLSQPRRATDVRFDGVRWEDRSFEPSPYYGYAFGWFFGSRPWFGVRAQFAHLKAIARTAGTYHASGVLDGRAVDAPARLDPTVQWLEVTHGLNMVTVSGLARVVRGRWQAHAGAGLGPVVAHAESTVRGANHETGYNLQDVPGFEAFAGMRWGVWRSLYGVAEYKFTRAEVREALAEGSFHAVFLGHHATFGLGLTF